MKEYGFNLKKAHKKTSAIRYLAVDDKFTGEGIGKALIKECLLQAKKDKQKNIILHTMDTMKEATKIYTQYNFIRHKNIDFKANGISAQGYMKNI